MTWFTSTSLKSPDLEYHKTKKNLPKQVFCFIGKSKTSNR